MTPEIEHYCQFFEDLHGQIEGLLEDLPAEAINWRPLAGEADHVTNSLAVLVTHVTGAEQYWIGQLLGGREIDRQRETEFRVVSDDVESLRQRLRATDQLTREVLTSVDPARLAERVQIREDNLTLRWGVIHMIEHAANHLGHMQLTIQLWRASRPATNLT
jgi:uncharacterized damage-inducible protein DinB